MPSYSAFRDAPVRFAVHDNLVPLATELARVAVSQHDDVEAAKSNFTRKVYHLARSAMVWSSKRPIPYRDFFRMTCHFTCLAYCCALYYMNRVSPAVIGSPGSLERRIATEAIRAGQALDEMDLGSATLPRLPFDMRDLTSFGDATSGMLTEVLVELFGHLSVGKTTLTLAPDCYTLVDGYFTNKQSVSVEPGVLLPPPSA